METKALRLLIRQKLADGRLPRHGVPRVWGSMGGDGQQCDACEQSVTKFEFAMEGRFFNGGSTSRAVNFHVLCFHVWDDERRCSPDSPSPSSAPDGVSEIPYKGHTIVMLATKDPVSTWSVTVCVLDSRNAIVMDPFVLGNSVTFDTKGLAERAAGVLARDWIDRRS